MRSAFYALINFINTSKVDDVYSNAAKMILENINKIQNIILRMWQKCVLFLQRRFQGCVEN